MTENRLTQLHGQGQSFWFDGLSRQMIEDGTIKRMVREDGLRGITSNPTIFAEALSQGSKQYDEIIAEGAVAGRSPEQVFDEIAKHDIRDACDILRAVYDDSGGRDGFVSLEESPRLAHDEEASVREGHRLYELVDRPNLLVKVPATPEGTAAFRRLISEGCPVNVTLMFSLRQYDEVAEAYISALEDRHRRGEPLDVPSVASIFVSRIDAKIDGWIDETDEAVDSPPDEGAPDMRRRDLLTSLRGTAAVANAQAAYARFKELFRSERFGALAEAGARPQRLLFASTGTKDPVYPDTKYVDALIGPDTVSTMPMPTVDAFRDHGTVTTTLEDGEGHELEQLAKHGIDIDRAMAELLHEGVEKFAKSYDELIELIADKLKTEASARR